MVYCDQDMCESKLGKLMQAFRADRPSEWQMDEFIGMAEQVHKMNKDLLAALEDAATSLEAIQLRSYGEDSFLDSKPEMRSYAGSRASVAMAAIAKAKGGAA